MRPIHKEGLIKGLINQSIKIPLFAISPFSIKFTPFRNYRIKMQYRNDFWECIKPALVKLNQQVLQSFKDKRCNNYIGDMLLMTLLRCWLIFYLFIT